MDINKEQTKTKTKKKYYVKVKLKDLLVKCKTTDWRDKNERN